MSPLTKYVNLIPVLRERFEGASKRYQELSSIVRPEVTRYEWSDGAHYSLRPVEFVLGAGGCQGRLFKREPKRKSGRFRYAFSRSGEILLEEQYTEFAGRIYEAFRDRSSWGSTSTLYDYSPEKRYINVEQLFGDGEASSAYIRYAKHGVLVEVYEYDNERIARVLQQNRMHDTNAPSSYSFKRELVFVYQGDQVWQVVATYEDGRTSLLVDCGELL